MKKTLNQYCLGEEITKEDAINFFGKEIVNFFDFPIHLVGITFTIQDKNETQMDYTLKHKTYIEKEGKK